LLCQGGKGVLGDVVTGEEVIQQRLRFFLGSGHGLFIGGVADRDQNVADVGQLIGAIHLTHEVEHIVAGLTVLNIGGVAGLAAAVGQPIAVELQAVGEGVLLAEGGGIVLVGFLAVLVGELHRIVEVGLLIALGSFGHFL